MLCVLNLSLLHTPQDRKNNVKKKSLLFKAFKRLKTRDEGYMINIPEAVCMVASTIGNIRTPMLHASDDDRMTACHRCVDVIHRHLCLMNSLCKVCVCMYRRCDNQCVCDVENL